MQKIVLFDIDGVIQKCYDYQQFYNSLNTNDSMEKVREFYTQSDFYRLCESGLMSIEDFWKCFCKEIDTKVTLEEFLDIHEKCKGEIVQDTIEVMKRLKKDGYKVGVLSNLKSIDVDVFRKRIDSNSLDYEFYSCYVHAMKPDADIFNTVAKVLKPKENKIYFLDNVLDNCLEANKWGINAIQTDYFDILEKSKNL